MWINTLAILAGLAAVASITTLIGLAARNRRNFRQNPTQGRAGLVQNIEAGLCIAAIILFAIWSDEAADPGRAMFDWPAPLLVTASTCALISGLLTIPTILALPAVWQGGRRVDSWSGLRKTFFTSTVLIYAALAVILALWRALSPRSG